LIIVYVPILIFVLFHQKLQKETQAQLSFYFSFLYLCCGILLWRTPYDRKW